MALTKVSTDGVKDDAITSGKIPANQIEASELADNAVDTNAIADQAVALSKLPHGTSSNDGKFLRANNGADPTFETVTGTTINNNADNRVITGSGTANTLEGEANLTFDGDELQIHHATDPEIHLNINSHGDVGQIKGDADGLHLTGNGSSNQIRLKTNNTERLRIQSNGNVGIGTTNPTGSNALFGGTQKTLLVGGSAAPQLRIQSSTSGQADLILQAGNSAADAYIANAASNGDLVFSTNNGSSQGTRLRILDDGGICFNSDTAAANALDDYEEGTWTPDFRVHSYLNNANSFTYSSRIGQYTKIGRQVHITAYFRVTDFHTYTGNLYLFGLPFNPMSSHQPPILMVGDHASFSGTDQMGMFVIIEGGNSRGVVGHQQNNGWSHMTRSEMKTGVGYISGTYYV